MWQRVCLPGAGSLMDQDPWLMAALDHLCNVHNQIEIEDRRRARQKAKQEQAQRG